MKISESNIGRVGMALYTSCSLIAAAVFFTITLTGDFGWVARIGGATWVFLLAMVILMPTVPAVLRSWVTGEKLQFAEHDHEAMLRAESERNDGQAGAGHH
jgi:hypothetical protein